MRVATRPINDDASQKANDDFYANHPELIRSDGSRIPLKAGDPRCTEWMDLYIAHGGGYKTVGEKNKDPKDPKEPCPENKTITGKIVTLTFRSDHLDSGQKQLKPSPGEYKDAAAVFNKPEWQDSPGKSDPISHTKNQNVKIDIEVDFEVTPSGCSGKLTKIVGTCSDDYLSFELDTVQTVTTGRQKFTGLVSKAKLPNFVTLIKSKSIAWTATVDGEEKSLGSSGPHKIYVTFDKPLGKMDSTVANTFEEKGKIQDVTEERLTWSVEASEGKGVADEKECVDAVFERLLRDGVGYSLGKRWEPGAVNNTGITPKPTLHTYLWRCNATTAKGECHNIAAAFIIACRILGVKGAMDVGFMYPWPSRQENHPTYAKRGDSILGKYNIRYERTHTGEGHGAEFVVFIDGNGFTNNFEGVATYQSALYAIGEGRYDLHGTRDENASTFYSRHSRNAKGKVTSEDLTKGLFELVFADDGPWCSKPYPSPIKTTKVKHKDPDGNDYEAVMFFWHD